MPFSVFLTSDIHLGMKFAGFPEAAQAALVEARFRCLERMVEEAGRRRCDLFVVAGDLFDRISVSARDVRRAASALAAFPGKLALVMPGNHDYLAPGDPLWPAFRAACGDAVLFLDEARPYPLSRYDVDACLYPGPCLSRHSRVNAVGWVKAAPRDPAITHHVGIAHGSLEGFSPDFKEDYYPMRTAELLQTGLELWLMGHTHLPFPRSPGAADRIYYPGTPEPDGFDCTHEGSAWVVELDVDGGTRAAPVRTGSLRFVEESLAIREARDLEHLESRYGGEEARRMLLRVTLAGRLPRESLGDVGSLARRMADRLLYLDLRTGALAEEITPEMIDREYPQGSFPHSLLTRLAGDAEALALAQELLEESRR